MDDRYDHQKRSKTENRQNMVSVSFPVFYPVLWSIIRLLSSLPVLLQKRSAASTRIAPKRLASLVDIFACAFLAVMPHDGGMLMTSEMANISPVCYPAILCLPIIPDYCNLHHDPGRTFKDSGRKQKKIGRKKQ